MEKALVYAKQRPWLSLLWYWGPVLSYACLIFYLSAQTKPEEQLPEFLFKQVSDKVLHAMEFGILGVLCYRAFRRAAGPVAARRAVMLAVAAASGYAVTDEAHQLFVPSREASVLDWIADTVGAAIGSFAWSHLTRSTE